ncbi:MAG: hypothetical protein DWQ01_01160 [Planctomycetota bacterium]|nr:MAG: hypothetical protein DWQ01_01160 [Planctomycetota bacterium]
MNTESNKRLVKQYYEEVVSKCQLDRVESFVAEDYVEVHDNKRYPIGRAGAKEHILGVRSTYPDMRLIVHRQIAEGEWVVTQLTMRGTHSGEWQGILPTGRTVEISAVNVDRVVDGQIVEHGGAANMLGPFLEIGAVKIVDKRD